MALLPILTAPDPRLKQKAKPVDGVDDGLRRLMDDMLETMYAAPGIGLAAPQVGVAKRVIVVDISHEDEPKEPLRMANPEVVWASDHDACYEEGCLSVPDHYADVTRPAEAKIRYVDEQNEIRELYTADFLATVVQHEIDHLDGILFIDHLSQLKRNMILRKLQKSKKHGKAPSARAAL
ncbi:MAG: peptide deformylase [Alphaproteobacteria bacterium]|nr:peptide deformylase [Alphaproteobacteria bacterium]